MDSINNPNSQLRESQLRDNRVRAIDALTGAPYALKTEHLKRIVEVTERIFVPLIGYDDIVLGFLDGASYPPLIKDNRIRITIWINPIRSRKLVELRPPDGIGHSDEKTLNISVMLPLGGTSREIRYYTNGPVVAQIFHRHIHVLANITDTPSTAVLRIYELILMQGLEVFIANGDITLEQMLSSVSGTSDDDILKSLMYTNRSSMEELSRGIAILHTEIENVKRLIDTQCHEILRTIHTVGSNEHSLRAEATSEELTGSSLSNSAAIHGTYGEQLRSEFDLIATHPLARYVPHATSTSLTVYSQHITVRHRDNNDLHDMGFYRMIVPICSPSDYRWYNLSRRVQGYSPARQHPHIFAEGYGCLGNAREMMASALDNGDFYGMVHLGLRFVTNCHVRDLAGKYLVNWPRINEYPP